MLKHTIIIPVYNVEHYLKQCLDSIVSCYTDDTELILVDDGSKDASGSICDEYAELYSNINVFHIKNSGASHARNIGLDHAKGEWISFVDSDDWVSNEYFEILKKHYEEDVLFFPASQYYENGDITCHRPLPRTAYTREGTERVLYDLKYGYLGDIFGWTWDKFFKKNIIDKYSIRFVEDIVYREDEIFTMDYCRHIKSIRILDKVLYFYRVRNDGLTSSGIQESDFMNLSKNIDRNLSSFHNELFLKQEKRRAADYIIELFKRRARIWNMHRVMNEIYEYFKSKPYLKDFASDKQIVGMLSHSYIVSYLLLEIWMLLSAIRRRL